MRLKFNLEEEFQIKTHKNLGNWFDSQDKNDGYKHQKIDHLDTEIKTSESLKNVLDPKTRLTSPTFLRRWRKGDDVFAGKFSSGVTPKIPRPVYRVDKPQPRILFNLHEDSDSQYGINPFISITPQMTYKKRSISFHNNVHMEDDKFCISPKSTVKSKYADTPAPKKTLVSNLKFGSENDSFEDEQDRIARNFIKCSNPRGSRFEEDFEEISTVGRGNFGSVVRCRNKLDGIEYAIKITDQNTPKHGNSMIEALQEVYALSALSVSSENPYIVRYYRGWIDDEQLFIQMEL